MGDGRQEDTHHSKLEIYTETWRLEFLKIKHVMQDYSIPLLLGACISLIWINSSPATYEHVFGPYNKYNHPLELLNGTIFGHHATFLFLINDGFMVFFFGHAAKEIVESLLPGGSLNPLKKAICPLFATLGGIIGPVLVFLAILSIQIGSNAYDLDVYPRETLSNGWVVATPTDIPLACLLATSVFGKGHPAINFLLLLAIADDALGLIIIAVFYPDPHHPVRPAWLCLVLCGMLAAFLMRRLLKCNFWQPYVFLCGFPSWVGLMKSGIHPALALVPIVPFIPGDALCPRQFPWPWKKREEPIQYTTTTPLNKFEHDVKDFIDFGMFFFGLANAGVRLTSFGHMTVCVALSLMIGKPFGILTITFLVSRIKGMHHGLETNDLLMMAVMSGLALTVSLFVAGIAFEDIELQEQAKLGALLASILIGIVCLAVAKSGKLYKVQHNHRFMILLGAAKFLAAGRKHNKSNKIFVQNSGEECKTPIEETSFMKAKGSPKVSPHHNIC
mmetsp:Transcript_29295/g.38513  ORF Transcript_29295/g.38513 Transcript_29295/m.38513 type:complete len:502 (+) Transcript_29295:399-1904(+)|eukprot:CAMPEP_0117751534 /NCGR_PEP_ID=MMETSP0947-20121206/11035_1 /TAXON_ID=44440 /ORGANISM="Chattonella subsalsa, Strain CCMP2191" /LENGTH=501 /DNA_ID=CAMNT_0005569939 /DNA_START=325 /DNA_END=1830 /DNA_ORIENTATION=-